MIQPDKNGLYHPATEDDIVELIQYAIAQKLQVRVRGAAESADGAVFTDADTTGNVFGKYINMELNNLRSVTIDKSTMQVTVGGGCNLGFDPFDPSETSDENDANNLFYQLNQNGLAIPNVPNAIHQTVAGFISTGSSGGTMQHSFDECILAIRMIDGTGKVQTFTKSDDLTNPFYGVVVSMGLLGIITEVTLQCQPAFNIIGHEVTTDTDKSAYNFFGTTPDPRQSLQDYLTQTEFSRILWWPYKTLNRLISWQAKTMTAADYTPQTGTPPNFTPSPYKPLFPAILKSTLPTEFVASTAFELIATWPNWFYNLTGNQANSGNNGNLNAAKPVVELLFPYVYPLLTDMFFPVDTPQKPGQNFWDTWLGSLPMDKVEFSNNLFDLEYSEMWVPIGLANQVINTMQQHYTANGYTATGFYTVEILAGKNSNFWLSPAYQTDVIRLNIMYFKNSALNPEDYYNQFWTLLAENKIPFRPHWGKNLPLPTSTTGPTYLQSQYPKWNDFMNLRKQMDPNNIFLTTYWKSQLGIDG